MSTVRNSRIRLSAASVAAVAAAATARTDVLCVGCLRYNFVVVIFTVLSHVTHCIVVVVCRSWLLVFVVVVVAAAFVQLLLLRARAV